MATMRRAMQRTDQEKREENGLQSHTASTMVHKTAPRLFWFFAGAALITVAGLLSVWVMGSLVLRTNGELIRSEQTQGRLLELLLSLTNAQMGQRGYLLTGDERYLEPQGTVAADIREQLRNLDRAADEGMLSKRDVGELSELAERKLVELAQTIEQRRTGLQGASLAVANGDVGRRLMEDIRGRLLRMGDAEQVRQDQLFRRSEQVTHWRTIAAISGALLSLIFLWWSYWRIRGDVERQKTVERDLDEGRQQFEGIVASAMDAIISVDEQQRIVLFNKAAEVIFRCPADSALGAPLERFLPERFRKVHRQHMEQFGKTGLSSRTMGAATMALCGVRGDGEEFPIDASISQVQVGEHHIYTVILRDVTERKRAEDNLRHWHAELEQRVQLRTTELAEANQELEAFGYSVSHDLRAPLRHVTSFVELLDRHAGASIDQKGQHYIRTISEAAKRMASLIDDLLLLSRLGRTTMAKVEVKIGQIVEEAIAQLAPETAGRRIQWKIGEMPQVMGDPVLLRNVMVNLLGNAVKYTRGREEAVIEVGSRMQDQEAICFVRDNGVGFDMKFVDKLFGVFQRLHRPEEFEGTGIGLASVRRIIHRHGGRTWAEGEVDKGATLYFSLPMERNAA